MLSAPTTNTPTTPVLPFLPPDSIIEPDPPTSSSPSFAVTSATTAPHSLYWDFSELISLGTPLPPSLTAVPSPLLPPPPVIPLAGYTLFGHPATQRTPISASGNAVCRLVTPSESVEASGENASSPKVTLSGETPTAEAVKDEERERAAQRKRDEEEEERTNMVTLADRLAATKKEQQPDDAYFEYIQKHSPRKLKGEPVLSLFAVNNLPMDGAFYRENEWRESGGQGLDYMGFGQDSTDARKFGGMKTDMDMSMGMYGDADGLMMMMSDTESLDDEEEEDELAAFGFGKTETGIPMRTASEMAKEAGKSKRRVESDSGLYENSRSRKIRRGESHIYTTEVDVDGDDENELPVVLDSCSYSRSSPTAIRIPAKVTGSNRWSKGDLVESPITGTESTKKRGRGRPPKKKKLLLEKVQLPEFVQPKQHAMKTEASGKKKMASSKASHGLVSGTTAVNSAAQIEEKTASRSIYAKSEKTKARPRRASISIQETIPEGMARSPKKSKACVSPERLVQNGTLVNSTATPSSDNAAAEEIVEGSGGGGGGGGLIVKRGRGRPKKQLLEVVVDVAEVVKVRECALLQTQGETGGTIA